MKKEIKIYIDGWAIVLPDGSVHMCTDAPNGVFESKAKAVIAASLIPGCKVEVVYKCKWEKNT